MLFYSDVDIASGGQVYEFSVPKWEKMGSGPIPIAKTERFLGDIYRGRQKLSGENGFAVNSLRWDQDHEFFYFTFGANYDPSLRDDPSFGWTEENISDVPTFKLSNINRLKRRGGTLSIPEWFAKKYTQGYKLGIGFGGYYSIINGGSAGPCLMADIPGSMGGPLTLLDHPWSETNDHSTHARRPADYSCPATSWVGKSGGTWTAADEIGGETNGSAAIWIDLPDKHGVLFWSYQGTGSIRYQDGQIKTDGHINRVYIYSPDDLGKVATETILPWQPKPTIEKWNWTGRVSGACFDNNNRTLYLLRKNVYFQNGLRHMIDAFKIQ